MGSLGSLKCDSLVEHQRSMTGIRQCKTLLTARANRHIPEIEVCLTCVEIPGWDAT